MLTRLQAQSAQSKDLTTSSGANPLGSSPNFWQGSIVVDNLGEAGSPFWLAANGSSKVLEFSVSKCKKQEMSFK